ncbi:hypothetical protein [Paraburkholderia mimosarum]|uniref:hypothetical protein n=1 Tax=Paraburkholderia mimosarum TaxID=312026 RepID=UPI0004213D9A|nr:hypothetical protein [Paraburkholderia mimosarum]
MAGYRTGRAHAAVSPTMPTPRQPVIAEQVALFALRGEIIAQDIALTKALGGGYRSDSPVELKPR